MALFLLFLSVLALQAQPVQVLYAPSNPAVGPYPAGVRPNAGTACPECPILNQLDGFALEPMLKVRFSGAVRPETLRDGVFVVWLDAVQKSGFTTYPERYVMPVNQVAWDPKTFTMYAKPDEALDPDRNYALIVTNAVRDVAGAGVAADPRFSLVAAGLPPITLPSGTVVAATTFHTRNVTATLLAMDPRTGLGLRKDAAIDLEQVQTITNLFQTSADPSQPLAATPFPADASFIQQLGLRRLAIYHSDRDSLGVNIWIPNSPPPPGGYPVVLIGHGFGDQRFAGPTLFASAFIGQSAVITLDAFGHGYGPNSQIRFELKNGSKVDVSTYGRGRDLDGDGKIGPTEGCIVFAPGRPDFIRTCLRQTVFDYRKLVREIQLGIDLDGDGKSDLDANRVQYLGQSLGAMMGTILLATEPGIDSAVLNVGGGSALETARYSPDFRPLLQQYVVENYPELTLPGAALPDPLIPRYRPVQILAEPKAGPYLELLDRLAMIEADGAAASFAPLLKQATLYGNPIKRVLFQLALGDRTIPNPANSQLIRGAFEYDLVSLYRHDLARKALPALPANPHAYMAAFVQFDPASLLIGLATLNQASEFLASGRREVPNVNRLVRLLFPEDLFETPQYLPETVNFVP